MMEKFGHTGLTLFFIFLFVYGMMMAAKVLSPQIRKVSASMADVVDRQ